MRARRRFARGGLKGMHVGSGRRLRRRLRLLAAAAAVAVGAWLGFSPDTPLVGARNTPVAGTEIGARAGDPNLLVIDGDTLRIRSITIRLAGIDAPERGQPCDDEQGQGFDAGAMAARQLAALLVDTDVMCRVEARDRYGRAVASCAAGGRDVGRTLVEQGWARAMSGGSFDYFDQEQAARTARRGQFSGRCDAPGAWRQRQG